eukprot:COSAG03_NODE_16792_length_392_cov_0.877133_1_plen_20_part_10
MIMVLLYKPYKPFCFISLSH